MKKSKRNCLLLCGDIAKGANAVLNVINNIILVTILLYGLFALNDTWSIFQGAGVNDALLKFKPELDTDVKENPSIQELVAAYPDARAWLTLTDTNIDYHIVQSTDNQTYVNKDIDGVFSLSGTIFLDCQNTGDFSDVYNIIYGHHMEMEKMFGGLDLYKEEEYLKQHTEGYLFLPEETYEIAVFATLSTDAYDREVFIPFRESDEQKESLLEYIATNALVYREVDFQEEDSILAMSTCSDIATNQRIIVFAKISK